jgi:predicted anti-sigma-YlaC factor YlaD
MVRGRSQECERTRRSISAALDGELSEFESMLLGAHLGGCGTCREFEASAQLSTTALRAAPLEQLSRPVALPSKRRRGLGLRVPSAAAAAALMVVVGGVFESFHGGAANPSGRAFDNNADIRALAKRQQQANFDQLLARRALYESNRIPRHPGFQNP